MLIDHGYGRVSGVGRKKATEYDQVSCSVSVRSTSCGTCRTAGALTERLVTSVVIFDFQHRPVTCRVQES